jgi:hypothetical protein
MHRYVFRATNRSTGESNVFKVTTRDGAFEYGDAAAKAKFLRETAEGCVRTSE